MLVRNMNGNPTTTDASNCDFQHSNQPTQWFSVADNFHDFGWLQSTLFGHQPLGPKQNHSLEDRTNRRNLFQVDQHGTSWWGWHTLSLLNIYPLELERLICNLILLEDHLRHHFDGCCTIAHLLYLVSCHCCFFRLLQLLEECCSYSICDEPTSNWNNIDAAHALLVTQERGWGRRGASLWEDVKEAIAVLGGLFV